MTHEELRAADRMGTNMIKLLLALAITAGYAGCVDLDEDSASLAAPPGKLLVLWGQSNAHGMGDVDLVTVESGLRSDYPAVDATYHHANGWSNPLVWTTRKPGALRPYSAAGSFGVELSMMRRLDEAEPGRWNIVKVSCNGASLGGWQSFSPTATNPVPNLFRQAMAFTLAAVERHGVTADNVVLVWIQGEADAKNSANSAAYSTNLAAFMDAFRAEIPGAAIYLNRLSSSLYLPTYPYREIVRAQQAAYLKLDSNAVLVDDAGLTLLDRAHLDHNSLVELGDRFAAAILETP